MTTKSPAMGLITPTEDARVQVATIGGNWADIPGVSGVDITGGQAQARDIPMYQGTAQYAGHPTPGSVEITLAAVAVAHGTYATLMDAYTESKSLRFRWQYLDRDIASPSAGAQVSIATDGTVSFNTGANVTHPTWGQGNVVLGTVIRTGTAPNYRYDAVESYDASGVPTVATSSTAVSDASYTVVGPPVYQPQFVGRVTSFGRISAPVDSQLSSNIMVVPQVVLPKYEVGLIIT